MLFTSSMRCVKSEDWLGDTGGLDVRAGGRDRASVVVDDSSGVIDSVGGGDHAADGTVGGDRGGDRDTDLNDGDRGALGDEDRDSTGVAWSSSDDSDSTE